MSETIDLNNLDIDLTGVDLSRPLLPRQVLRARIGEVRAERDEKRGRQLIVPLILEEPGKDTNGEEVKVGFVIVDRIGMDPIGNRTTQMVNEQLGKLQAAALKLTDKKLTGPLRASEFPGKEVLITLDVRPDKQDSSKLYQDVKGYAAIQ